MRCLQMDKWIRVGFQGYNLTRIRVGFEEYNLTSSFLHKLTNGLK